MKRTGTPVPPTPTEAQTLQAATARHVSLHEQILALWRQPMSPEAIPSVILGQRVLHPSSDEDKGGCCALFKMACRISVERMAFRVYHGCLPAHGRSLLSSRVPVESQMCGKAFRKPRTWKMHSGQGHPPVKSI